MKIRNAVKQITVIAVVKIIFSLAYYDAAFVGLHCEKAPIKKNVTNLQIHCTIPLLTQSTDFSAIPINRTIILTLECLKNATSQIANNTFIEFVRLQSLILRECEFDELPEQAFQGLTNLQTLRIERSKQSELKLRLPSQVSSDLKQITSLVLKGIGIHTIPELFLRNLESLQDLSLPLNNVNNLEWLNLLAHHNPHLTSIDMSDNCLTAFPPLIFRALPQLLSLRFDYCSIESVHEATFEGLFSLSTLSLKGNYLATLPSSVFHNLSQLKVIDLSGSKVSILPNGIFNGLTNLRVLNLEGNKINFPVVSQRPFRDLSKLQKLYLTKNNITVLNREVFQGLENIVNLHLSLNDLSHVSLESYAPVAKSLKFLWIGNANLTSLELLTNFSGLKFLNAQMNGLRILQRDWFSQSKHSLETITLTRTSLTALVEKVGENAIFADFPTLKTLILFQNMIDRFDYFMIPDSVTNLELTANRVNLIEDMYSLRSKKKLSNLEISYNPIYELNPSSFSYSLKTISCNYCNITTIRQGTFGKLLHLQSVKFLNSKVRKIERFAFSVFPGKPLIKPSVLFNNELCPFSETQIVNKLQFLPFKEHDSKENHICQFTTYCKSSRLNNDHSTSIATAKKWKRSNYTESVTLDCGMNKLSSFNFTFIDASFVNTFYADGNFVNILTNNSFHNYSSLQFLHLNNSQVSSVESGAFLELVELEELYLHDNYINHLNFNQFQTLKKLTLLSLRNNQLSSLNYKVFKGIKQLRTLHLDSNLLNKLQGIEFYEPRGLQNLTLTKNNMTDLGWNSFLKLYQLIELHLEYNSLTRFSPRYLAGTKQLEKLFLNDNKFSSIENYTFSVNLKLKKLHLERNFIREISSTAFLQLKVLDELHLEENRLKAVNSAWFTDMSGLTDLYLNSNDLSEISGGAFVGAFRLINLRLHNNSLKRIDSNALSSLKFLRTLTLHNNKLSSLDVWKLPNSLMSISLRGNEFSCDCDFLVAFRNWVISPEGSNKITDIDDVVCIQQNGSRSLVPILQHTHKYCETHTSTLMILLISGGCFLTLIVISVLTYMHRLEMQVWLYSRYGLRLFYKDNDADKGKVYHAFISYSSDDEVFVAENLCPNLEPEYNLCVHGRDFPVGAYIIDTVCEVVEKSCRTILVLTNNFVKSEWCRFEFKVAHHQTLQDHCCRLIVVLMEDVDVNELDRELRIYLKTNTYLEWGDRFFWEKLRFAMPDIRNLEEQEERQPLLVQ